MRPARPRPRLAGLALLAACGGDATPDPDAAAELPPASADWSRDLLATDLEIAVEPRTAVATITIAGSDSTGLSLEIGDLEIERVTDADGTALHFEDVGAQLDVGVPSTTGPTQVVVTYGYADHPDFDGATDRFTFLWPYFCGNLFPCKSDPADGLTMTLALTDVPAGQVAVYPPAIPGDAPSYQLAWAIDAYVETALGTTTAGTDVSVWHTAAQAEDATAGTANLVAAFDWFETTLGAYTFGDQVGSVGVTWGPGAYGGMEHHPRWHVGRDSLADQDTHVHEAGHGWFGDGIRIACWEDLVLSEGTTTYLSGRALDVVAPEVGADVWAANANILSGLPDGELMWPETCGEIDVIEDDLWNSSIYYRGAFFYRAIAASVGAEALDAALAAFYQAHVGGTATMADMLATIEAETGFDPSECAQIWLRDAAVPAPGTCVPI
jgi:hypothetical protein